MAITRRGNIPVSLNLSQGTRCRGERGAENERTMGTPILNPVRSMISRSAFLDRYCELARSRAD
jgi:hypothetical protein